MDHDGLINYPEFLKVTIGELKEERKKVVDEAYRKMDKGKNQSVKMDDIRDLYRADRHPDVLSRKKPESEILEEFLDTFEQHHLILVLLKVIK